MSYRFRSVISCFFIFSIIIISFAIGSDNIPKTGLNEIERFNPNAPRFGDLVPIEQSSSSFSRPSASLLPLEVPTTVLPPQYFCDYLDYSEGNVAYFWRSPDQYNDFEQGVRLSLQEGYICTLLTAYIGIYGTQQGTHQPADMLVTVYEDNGFGLPGTVLGSTVVPYASLPTTGLAYVPVDLSTLDGGNPLVFDNYGWSQEFHIGCQVYNWEDGDTLFFLSDDGSTTSETRAWENCGGVYGFMYDDWGDNLTFCMGVDVCCNIIPYSVCSTLEYACPPAYYWTNPDAYGDDYFNMRFTGSGADTISRVGVAIYEDGCSGVSDLEIYVWGSDGNGFPDITNELAKVIIPYADIAYYPDYNIVDLYSLGIVVHDDFHVGWSTADPVNGTLAGLSDGGSCGVGRSSEYTGGQFNTMLSDWGADVNFLIFAELCKDPFPECRTINYTCGLAWFWRLPDSYGDIADYQRFSPSGQGCRLEKARIAFYWPSSEAALPLYTYNSEFQVLGADVLTGLPDPTNVIKMTTITPADYVIYPGMTEVDYTLYPDPILFDEDIWFGVESFAPSSDNGIRTLSDNGSCGSRRSAENYNGTMEYMVDGWGDDINFLMEIDVCCMPEPPSPCYSGDDWPTFGKDFARTGASISDLGPDVQSNLSMIWRYINATTQTLLYNPPSIYGDTLVAYMGNEVVAIDMNDGSEIWTRGQDGFEIGAGGMITPTIYNFDAYGTAETYVFIGGADAKSFNCLRLTDGSTVWTRNFTAHNLHFMSFAPNVIVDCGGVPVIIYADDDGNIYAVEALTGNPYTGWTTNPINFGGAIHTNMATDGASVFVGTYASGVIPGTVFAFDACTGNVLWEFTDHQMAIVENTGNLDDNAIEEFQSGITVDFPYIFAPSTFDLKFVPAGNYITGGGLMYAINISDGSYQWVQIGRQVWDGIHLSLGVNHINVAAWNDWNNPGFHELCGVWAYNKNNGQIIFKHTMMSPGPWDLIGMGPVTICVGNAPDWIIATTRWNFINFFRDTDGAQMFHRRWSGYFSPNTYSYGHPSGQIMSDGRLIVFARNNIVCLSAVDDTPRPRLDIRDYEIDVSVPFGMPDHYLINVPDAVGNMGGAPLTLDHIALAPDDNGSLPDMGDVSAVAITTVGADRLDRIEKLSRMYADAFNDDDISDISLNNYSGSSRNNSAFTIPSWVYGIISPVSGTVIPPQGSYNDSANYVDILLDINGTEVPRGATPIYIDIYSNDPDYFLDSAKGSYAFPSDTGLYMTPQLRVNLIGGCLYEDVELAFGVGSSNYWTVWNSTKLADGDITSNEIDGDHTSFWQGGFVFSKQQTEPVPPGKISGIWSGHTFMHQDGWNSGSIGWESILPDPNCYDATCAPNHRTNVLLGEISNDQGETYEAVYGEVVAYAFVDSAQDLCNYDTLGNCTSWNWTDVDISTPPYNDTLTVAFRGCVEVIGVYDQPQLANFIINRMELSGRYAAVNDLYIGAILDYDIPTSDFDVANYDESHSLAYMYPCNTANNAWGCVKIPFGCGFTPMQGAKTVTANQGGWNDSAVWLDSVFAWMQETGLHHQPGTNPTLCAQDSDDREGWFTFGSFDLPLESNGSLTFGTAWFGVPDAEGADDASNYFALADMANKWCGFGRGDLNDDGKIDLVDIAYLIDYVYYGGHGPYPFKHLGDVNASGGDPDASDISVLIDYYFNLSGCLDGAWTLGGYTAP
ncbi:MAG: PQQ-binding-like beta-propeller repeat protein [Candidatus Zixiibacteriota bacterium]